MPRNMLHSVPYLTVILEDPNLPVDCVDRLIDLISSLKFIAQVRRGPSKISVGFLDEHKLRLEIKEELIKVINNWGL